MNDTVKENKHQALTTLLVILVILLVLVIVVSKDMQKIRAFIADSGWYGLLISILLYGLLGASPIPSEPLTVLIATIFGPFNATLVAGTGNLLAALIEYFIGGKIGDIARFKEQRQKLPFGLGKLPVDSALFMVGARMLPGYGPKFVSVICGVYRVPLWRYTWTAAIPTFLGAAIFAYGGFGLLHLAPIK